jgi:hypothetical protein
MNNYLLELLDRVINARKREEEKRNAEMEEYNRVLTENAEYIRSMGDAPHF